MKVVSKTRGLIVLGLLAVLCATTAAREHKPPQFQDGDSVCIVGDSITHGGKYQKFLYLFYATRFPDRKLRMYNCGVSGDTANGACARFEWDILSHKPTVATILLGMNDVGRSLYGKDKTDEASKKRQKGNIDRHVEKMKELAEKLKKAKCEIIFLTPTIYEQVAEMPTPNNFGCNDGLETCGEEAKKIAKKHRAGVVDVHALMNEISAKHQKDDPTFTIVGKDRVHPGDVGHFVVAYAILKAQDVPSCVATMSINAAKGKVVEQANCRITDLDASAEGVGFTCLASALPYPVADRERPALDLVPFMQEMNQERLIVTGLSPGQYEVVIDDTSVGEYSADELKAGINLAANPKTPQYQQAMEVHALNEKRHSLESGRLRTIAAMRHWTFSKLGIDPDDFEAAKEALEKKLAKMKESNSKYYKYHKGQTERFLKYKPQEKEITKDWQDAMAAMCDVNKPKPHRFVIKRK